VKILAAIACAVVMAFSGVCDARGGGGHSSGASHSSRSSTHAPRAKAASHSHASRAAPGVARDSHGKIARSVEAKDDFKRSHSCPSTGRRSGACPGYVIDHITPLKRGGADAPSNMQWQTTAAAKAKDKTE
jgi:hypothetical protein